MADEEKYDDPLVRDLQAPGTPDELSDEERYRAMFREASRATPLQRRRGVGAARRFGSGTALTVALAVTGTGVAAAYTGNLPDPIQEFAHRALGPVGPPAPEQHRQRATEPLTTPSTTAAAPSTSPTPQESSDPSPSTSASPTSKPSHRPSDSPAASGATGPVQPESTGPTTLPASPTPTEPSPTEPTPTSSPSPTPPPVLVPASVSISGDSHRVDVGQTVPFSGRVTTGDGTPVPRVRVGLERWDGSWQRVAVAKTAKDGTVRLTLPPVTQSTAVRMRIRGAHSGRWKVAMHPLMTLSSAPNGDGTVTINVRVQGGHAGDAVHLLLPTGDPALVASAVLGDDGSASFQVTPPAGTVRYLVYLDQTPLHTAEHEGIRLRLR